MSTPAHRADPAWAPLLPLAMIGTDRHAPGLPPWPGAVGQVLARSAAGAEPPNALLRAAAVLATCGAAGAQGQSWPHGLPGPAPSDARPAWPEGPELPTAAWALHEGPARLQHALLATLAQVQRRLAPSLLPQALELGRRSLALRPCLAEVLGERGLWLAAQRAEWQFAAGVSTEQPVEQVWQEGSLEQRLAVLQRERQADPAAARRRLSAALGELPARERAECTAVLAQGLSLEDEALLDELRGDRSRDVRQAACALLLRLPGAAHPQRAAARVAALLSRERVLLRQRWVVTAPEAEGSDWKGDNLDPTRPKHDTLGERAWWLYQLVRQVPLTWWQEQMDLSPAELLRWAQEGDWAEALLRGWRDVLLAAPQTAWCEAFLDAWPAQLQHEHPNTLLALLPSAARERHWLRHLREGSLPLHTIVVQVLAANPPGHTVPATVSAALADQLLARAQGRQLADEHVLRNTLPELSAALDVAALERLAQWPRHADESPGWVETLHTMTRVMAVRQALQALLPSPSP